MASPRPASPVSRVLTDKARAPWPVRCSMVRRPAAAWGRGPRRRLATPGVAGLRRCRNRPAAQAFVAERPDPADAAAPAPGAMRQPERQVRLLLSPQHRLPARRVATWLAPPGQANCRAAEV